MEKILFLKTHFFKIHLRKRHEIWTNYNRNFHAEYISKEELQPFIKIKLTNFKSPI